METHEPSTLLKPLYELLRGDLPVLPPKLDREALDQLARDRDLASRAFGLPLVWAMKLPNGQFSYGANETRLALMILQHGRAEMHDDVRAYAQMLGTLLAQDVAQGIHSAGPALLEDLEAAPATPIPSASTEDRARAHQAAHALGLDYAGLQKLLLGRVLH